jgi:hypothetical protein
VQKNQTTKDDIVKAWIAARVQGFEYYRMRDTSTISVCKTAFFVIVIIKNLMQG